MSQEEYKELDMVKGLKHFFESYATKSATQQIIDFNNPTSYERPRRYRRYTRADVHHFLKNPEFHARELREVSEFLFEVSPQYSRLIKYFGTLLTWDYTISPVEIDIDEINETEYLKSYKKYCDYVSSLNLKHEMTRIVTEAWRSDVYYGYKRDSKNCRFFQRLDPDFCRISSIVDDTFIYSMDMGYFDVYPKKLDTFPIEFKEMYKQYKENPVEYKWQEPPIKNQFCIKIIDSIYPTPIIPFAGVLEYVFRILDYVDLQEKADELDNYKIIGLKIPFDEEHGDIKLDKTLVQQFYDQLCNVLPSSVGAFVTPMDFDDISFEKSGGVTDSDLTTTATTNFWNSAGVSALIFGSGTTSSALNVSIKADTALAVAVGEQVERVINRILTMNIGSKLKFKINILPITLFNQSEINGMYLKNAQYGVPVKSMMAASLGMSPNEMIGMELLENKIFKLQNNWIPVSSSYTMNSEDILNSSNNNSEPEGEAGRPIVEGDVISDSNENTREHESNLNR